MINQIPNSNVQKNYDLEKRTSDFGVRVIRFCKAIRQNVITVPLINQLIRSGTSIGANYLEANEANSKKDFCYKIAIAKKEARETMHWLQMIIEADKSTEKVANQLHNEAHEFVLIFSAIIRNSKLDKNKL